MTIPRWTKLSNYSTVSATNSPEAASILMNLKSVVQIKSFRRVCVARGPNGTIASTPSTTVQNCSMTASLNWFFKKKRMHDSAKGK